jgi:hypothetical protein
MKLDERAGRAATDLLERASRRPIPTVEELERRTIVRRLPVRRLLAAAAVVAVIMGGLAFVNRDRPLPTVEHPAGLPVPVGITPQLVSPDGMGVTLELPSTWDLIPDNRGFAVGYGDADADDGFMTVSRVATTDPMDAKAFADLRHDMLEDVTHADVGDASATTIDAHDAAVRSATWQGIQFAEYSIDLEDGTWAVVEIGGRDRSRERLYTWIASTIAVDSTPLWSTPIDQPAAALPIPDGITPRTWEPDGQGFAVDLPSTWTELTGRPKGFDAGMASSHGPQTWVYSSRVSHALGSAEGRERVLERQFHARIVQRTDTVIDGHHARIVRYRIPEPDEPRLAALGVEYDIDLGTGESVWLAIGTRGGTPPELIDWIRSTIRVTP